MEYFLNSEGSVIVYNLIKIVQDNKEYLSEVDGAIGDGDHGINMNKGFTLCKERLSQGKVDLAVALKTLGKVLLTEIGGSMGPLYGTFFLEMSKMCAEEEQINKQVFLKMLQGALNGVSNLGNAKVGDKTLMDTLIPATTAFENAVSNAKSFSEALEDMKAAAEKGKDSTIDLVAKIGRASRLGERSRGVLDAGATSCNLLLQSMAITIKGQLK
ncbi:MAG: dihydroxyacetone kinase subunit DhaL [Ruminiclostridium sp.]